MYPESCLILGGAQRHRRLRHSAPQAYSYITVSSDVFFMPQHPGVGFRSAGSTLPELAIATIFSGFLHVMKDTVEAKSSSPSLGALQHTATRCNTLRHAATHRNTLQHTATHSLQRTATHCNKSESSSPRLEALQRTATHSHTLQPTAIHCNKSESSSLCLEQRKCIYIYMYICIHVCIHHHLDSCQGYI